MELSSTGKANLLFAPLALAAGAALGHALYLNTYVVDVLGVITYECILRDKAPAPLTGWYFIVLGVLFVAALRWICRKVSPAFSWESLGAALAPLLALTPTFFLPPGFYSPIIFTIIAGLTVFRLGLIIPFNPKLKPEISRHAGLLLALALFAALVVWFAYIQQRAVNILFLSYHDWGLYFNIIDNTLKGKWFYSDFAEGSFLPVHFEPGMALLLAPYVWLFRTPFAFFILTSALLFCGGLFVYLFARKLKISVRASLVMACCVLLFPSLSNMNIALFYGFHSLYVAIPLALLFFYWFEDKKYVAAFCAFFISLTVKETVAVFWVGLGLVYLFSGHRKFGLLLITVAGAYFFTIVKLVIPAISPQGAYDYYNRYSEYGGMLDIILAPVLKPALFWGMLFRPHCLAFITLLIMPLFTLLLSRPLLLLAGVITIGFVCLQTNDQLQNIAIWYQSEYLALLFSCLVLNYRALLQDTANHRLNPWFKVLAWKLQSSVSLEKLPTAAILSLLTTACLSHYFFGLSIAGKNSVMPILGAERCDAELRQALQVIPPGVAVSSTSKVAAHLVTTNPVSGTTLRDYVIIDVNDPINVRFADPTRFQLLKDKNYNLIANRKFKGHQLLIFHREPQIPIPPPVLQIPPEKWSARGQNIPVNNVNFAVRGGMVRERNGLRSATFFVRLLHKVDLDVEADIQLYDGKQLIYQRFLFGDGIYPACFAQPGECFPIKIILPENFGELKTFSVELRERVPIKRWAPDSATAN